MSRRYLITALLAAGFGPHDPLQASLTGATSTGTDDPDQGKLLKLFHQDHLFTLAQHRSHSSHSSHSSHRSGSGGHYSHSSHTSHRSSTGGYTAPTYTPPPPVYTPPAKPRPNSGSGSGSGGSGSGSESSGSSGGVTWRSLDSSPNTSTGSEGKKLPPLSGRSSMFKTIVMHVQVALMGQGLFEGPIDGTVGPATRAALRTFQGSHGLQVTGTITPETLDALHVPTL